jgi:L-methionine (R)-S-oxide reductase
MSDLVSRVADAGSFDAALALTIEHFKADSGTIHVLGDDGVLHLKAASAGIPPFVLEKVRLVPVGKGMAGLAVERAEPITVCNIQTDTSGDVRSGAKSTGLEGAIVVPMLRDGQAQGALGIANRAERTFSSEETAELIEVGKAMLTLHG